MWFYSLILFCYVYLGAGKLVHFLWSDEELCLKTKIAWSLHRSNHQQLGNQIHLVSWIFISTLQICYPPSISLCAAFHFTALVHWDLSFLVKCGYLLLTGYRKEGVLMWSIIPILIEVSTCCLLVTFINKI